MFPFLLLFSVDRNKYQIHIPLPPKIDPTVTMMQVEDKPDVTYSDVGGCKEQIEKLREVVETPLLHVRTHPLEAKSRDDFHSFCSLKNSSIWVLNRQRVFYYLVLQERVRRCALERLLTEQMHALFELLALN